MEESGEFRGRYQNTDKDVFETLIEAGMLRSSFKSFTVQFSETADGESQTSIYPRVCTTSLRDNYRYSRDYLLIANFIVMAFIPFLLLIIFNGLTFRIISSSSLTNERTSNRHRRDQRIAKMFIFIVIIFFICNMPRMILNTLDVSL